MAFVAGALGGGRDAALLDREAEAGRELAWRGVSGRDAFGETETAAVDFGEASAKSDCLPLSALCALGLLASEASLPDDLLPYRRMIWYLKKRGQI